jgi:Cdc6-like AAA superfamily ATPase
MSQCIHTQHNNKNKNEKKWDNELNRDFSKEEVQMTKKTHEELLNIPGHKGNVNQNHVKILPHSC